MTTPGEACLKMADGDIAVAAAPPLPLAEAEGEVLAASGWDGWLCNISWAPIAPAASATNKIATAINVPLPGRLELLTRPSWTRRDQERMTQA
jgi:hypothetical protein